MQTKFGKRFETLGRPGRNQRPDVSNVPFHIYLYRYITNKQFFFVNTFIH